MSMTSKAYGQEATEVSHTALMQRRLLQQMHTRTDTDSRYSRDGCVRPDSGSPPQHRSGKDIGGGVLQHPVRGSGHHHYLPSKGTGQYNMAAHYQKALVALSCRGLPSHACFAHVSTVGCRLRLTAMHDGRIASFEVILRCTASWLLDC